MSGLFRDKPKPHPTPEKALRALLGLTVSDLQALIKTAVDHGHQVAPTHKIERYYLAEIAGFKYSFYYFHEPVLGASYRLRNEAQDWSIEFRSSTKYPNGACRKEPYIMIPIISVTERVCFDFYLRGDKEKFREDMTKVKLFLC